MWDKIRVRLVFVEGARATVVSAPFASGGRALKPFALFGALALLAIPCAHAADNGYLLLELDGHHAVKWGPAAMDQGATLTYAVVEDRTDVAGTVNCRTVTGIHHLLTKSHVKLSIFEHQVKDAFAMWSAEANVSFRAVPNPDSADIVIAAQADPDGIAYTDVTPTPDMGAEIGTIRKSIICLNPDQSWTDARTAGKQAARQTYRLEYVLAHEIGHALGLDHPSPKGELMSFEYNPAITSLQSGDIDGIKALYGPSKNRKGVLALNGGPRVH